MLPRNKSAQRAGTAAAPRPPPGRAEARNTLLMRILHAARLTWRAAAATLAAPAMVLTRGSSQCAPNDSPAAGPGTTAVGQLVPTLAGLNATQLMALLQAATGGGGGLLSSGGGGGAIADSPSFVAPSPLMANVGHGTCAHKRRPHGDVAGLQTATRDVEAAEDGPRGLQARRRVLRRHVQVGAAGHDRAILKDGDASREVTLDVADDLFTGLERRVHGRNACRSLRKEHALCQLHGVRENASRRTRRVPWRPRRGAGQ